MEPAEDASLEPAIRWLAQSILANPLINEQAPWVREAGLAEEMEGLKSEIKGVQLVVSAVKGRALGNEPLGESLVELKELLYDADDAVDELDYCRLDQGGTRHDLEQTDGHHGALQADRSIHNAGVPSTSVTLPDPHETDGHGTQLVGTQSSSVGKLRSKLWNEFEILEFNEKEAPVRAKCKHCKTELGCPTKQGTGVLQNHLKSKSCPYDPLSTIHATTNPAPVATGNLLSSKKRRRDEESTRLITANTNRWNKDDFSKMIQDITLKLRKVRESVIQVLSILGSDFAASSNHSQGATSHQRRRTTGILQGRVYGRDFQKNNIIELIKKEKSATGATVLPILGIAGIGKTAVAQLVYNHPAVKEQFVHRIWIWVSNNFDPMKLTKDMLGYVSQETHVGLCNFAKLQEILESHIKSKSVLLILDDVWDDITDYLWNQLLAPFNSDNARDNMIIVTTRKPCVAKRRGTVSPITLGALESDDFWLFFEACAFGDVNDEKKESLSDLGKQIAQKLKGNPLAAETAAALLREHRTVAHWSSILKNEDWKSLTLSGGIMSALKLCYDKLPYHLQKCFSYCCLFPCNYGFRGEKLVRIWTSQGFVKRNSSSKSLEEIGREYLSDLVNLGFFEQSKTKSSSGYTKIIYVMYNLMYDFARVVSKTECATIDGLQCNRMFPTVRHLSISYSIYEMETGNIAHSEKFEEMLQNTLTSVGKLRSLVLIGPYSSSFFQFLFQKAHNLRLLHMFKRSADFVHVLCNLVNPAHLRYLKLKGHAEQGAFSQVLSRSFHLQELNVYQYSDNSEEPRILLSLERLQCLTRLKLSGVLNIREVSVPSLEELVLFEMPKLKKYSCTSVGDLKSNLRVLEIQSCPELEVFDHNSWFPSLKKLIICDCPNLHVMIPLPPSDTYLEIVGSSSLTRKIAFPSLESLLIESCGITGKWLSMLLWHSPTLKKLNLYDCPQLTQLQIGASYASSSGYYSLTSSAPDGLCCIPINLTSSLRKMSIQGCPHLIFDGGRKGFAGFTSLEKLKIRMCPELLLSLVCNDGKVDGRLLLPHSLEKLYITTYPHETLWPCFVGNLTHLKKLEVTDSPCLKSLQLISGLPKEGLPSSLEELEIESCSSELSTQCRSLATAKLRVIIDGHYI